MPIFLDELDGHNKLWASPKIIMVTSLNNLLDGDINCTEELQRAQQDHLGKQNICSRCSDSWEREMFIIFEGCVQYT